MFDLAQPEFDVVEARLLAVGGRAVSRLAHHVGRHVHADYPPRRTDLRTRKENVETAATAQVQDHLARPERGYGRRVPARQSHICPFRQRGELGFAVPHAPGHLLGGAGAAGRWATACPTGLRDVAIALADGLSDLFLLV